MSPEFTTHQQTALLRMLQKHSVDYIKGLLVKLPIADSISTQRIFM